MPDEQVPDNAIALADGVWVHPDRLRFRFSRSGGPGGQSVNKLNTRAELRVALGDLAGLDDAARHRLRRLARRWLTTDDELVIHADTTRSQLDNRNACIDRLAAAVQRAATPPTPRRRRKPTRAMIQRRIDAKKQAGEKKRRRRWRPGE